MTIHPNPHPDRENGFTMVELLVAVSISMVVVLATLQSLDVFASGSARQTRATDASDQVRQQMDRVVADLRGASVIVRAAATDLVYAVPETSTTNRIERLCVSGGELYGSSSVVAGTPVAPTAACASATKVVTLRSTSGTAFTYDGATSSATPSLVTDVGLTLSLDTSAGTGPASSTLTASAARRSAGTLPIVDGDLETSCNDSGALLSLRATLPNIAPLTVTYSSAAGAAFGPVTVQYAASGGATLGTPSGVTVQIPSGSRTIVARVTNALGVTNTIRKDVTCTS